MALNQLTALQVNQLSEPGRYSDGGGLYLNIKSDGSKSWIFRYQLNKNRRNMGLGAFNKKTNGLADARKKAAEKRHLVEQGIDPIEHARELEAEKLAEQERKRQEAEQLKAVSRSTFKSCAADYIKNKSAEWKNAKHKQQWENTLDQYVYPVIGDMPINDIEIDHVRSILDPIWFTKTETANRVRQRIEAVIDSSIAIGTRTKPNPANWKGLLSNFYPNPEKVKRNRHINAGTDPHFAAMPYDELPDFMAELVKMPGVAPIALRFLILTVPRTSELRFAEWPEFNLDKKQWDIPAVRMKAGIEHRVALPDAAVKLIEDLPKMQKYVFPGWKKGTALSDGAFRNVLQKMGIKDATPHGFRSSFRDYIGEETGFPHRLAEFALAHQLTDEAEKAYARGDMLKKRFAMMNAWANFVDSKLGKSKVVSISRAKR